MMVMMTKSYKTGANAGSLNSECQDCYADAVALK